MYRLFTAIITLGMMTTQTIAQDITNRDQLVDYLKEQILDGQMIEYTYKIGSTFSAMQRFGNCLSDKTFSRVNLITRLLYQQGLIDVWVSKEDTTYRFGSGLGVAGVKDTPACEYKVMRFSSDRYDELGIKAKREIKHFDTNRADGGINMEVITEITVPLVKQRLLGVQEVRLNGGISIGGTRCDIAFVPWFENNSPSKFVQIFRKDFEKNYRYKNMFSSEYKASTWCFQRHYDDTWKWKKWSRL